MPIGVGAEGVLEAQLQNSNGTSISTLAPLTSFFAQA